MNTIPTESTCPQCGKPVSLSAFEGLCPECLIRAGFGTFTAAPSEKTSAFIPPTPAQLAAHFPQLEILELLGRGGMGAVYKARQIHLDRIVALKILPPGIGHGPSFAERFIREAQALAKLHHPNIVTLYESGQADELFYFFMEFVDGVNLRQLLAAGTISPPNALAIVPQICDALQFAHDRGIVHRDIKPENILLNKAGQVKIADFGVAKLVAGDPAEPPASPNPPPEGEHTEAGKVIGTPPYMAPEQFSHPADVDNRADIYALGVVFYQMLTGELPVGKFEPPSRKVPIDVRLDEVVLRAPQKHPQLRYQQASALKTQVETIASDPTPPQVPFPTPPPAAIPHPPHRFLIAVLRWILVAFTVFTLTVLAGLCITAILPKVYCATSQIQISPRETSPPNALSPYDPAELHAEFAVMQSPAVLEPVLADLDLNKKWAATVFRHQKSPVSHAQALAHLDQMIRIHLTDFTGAEVDLGNGTDGQVRGSDIINVSVFSASPREAADIANGIVAHYKALREQEEDHQQSSANQAVLDQLSQVRKQIENDQAAMDKIQPGPPPQVQTPAYSALASDQKLQKGNYTRLMSLLQQVKVPRPSSGGERHSSVRILALAIPPFVPVAPNKFRNLIASIIVGLFLSVTIASLVEFVLWRRLAKNAVSEINTSPAAVSAIAAAPFANGKYLAIAGTILQALSILSRLSAGLWQAQAFRLFEVESRRDFDSLRTQGHHAIQNDLAGTIMGFCLEAAAVSTICFFAGLILLCIALAVTRYRAKWFFWFLAIYSWPLLLAFPFGTAAGIFFIVYCLSRREEFGLAEERAKFIPAPKSPPSHPQRPRRDLQPKGPSVLPGAFLLITVLALIVFLATVLLTPELRTQGRPTAHRTDNSPFQVTTTTVSKGDLPDYVFTQGLILPPGTSSPTSSPARDVLVKFGVPEADVQTLVSKFDAKQPLPIAAYNSDRTRKIGTGSLIAVDNEIDAETGTLPCKGLIFVQGDTVLLPNMFINVRLLLETRHDVTFLPQEALQNGSQGSFVYVIQPDHTVTVHPVTIGSGADGSIEIKQGLTPGETVVLHAPPGLKEGSHVR